MGTGVGPGAPGARPGGGIDFPLSGGQVKSGLDPKAFNLTTYPALLKKPDPWAEFRTGAVSLKPAMKKVL